MGEGKLIVQGGTVVTPEGEARADVVAYGEQIEAITRQATAGPEDTVVDASGCYVLPGVIDAHTHIKLDTGVYQTADDWFVGTRAAAFGGVTTVIDFATQLPGQTFRQAVEARHEEATKAVIDYALHCMVTNLPAGQEDRLVELIDMGVSSFKIYTTYRPSYYMDDAHIWRLLAASAAVGGLLMVHCENDALVTASTRALVRSGHRGWRFHAQGRPSLAEQEAIARVLLLAEDVNAPMYIVHCSTARSVEMVHQAREWGQTVFCETCPQYLLLDERVYTGPHPEHFILQPPLRTKGEGDLIWTLVAEGAVDVLSTDHCDYSQEQKTAVDDFTKTPGGLPGLETLLPLMYTRGVEAGLISLPQLVGMLSANPARVFGLHPKKGAILPGADADLVVYNPEPEGEVQADALHYAARYSPYEGMAVKGKVRATISRGELIVRDGQFCGEEGRGRFVPGRTTLDLERGRPGMQK